MTKPLSFQCILFLVFARRAIYSISDEEFCENLITDSSIKPYLKLPKSTFSPAIFKDKYIVAKLKTIRSENESPLPYYESIHAGTAEDTEVHQLIEYVFDNNGKFDYYKHGVSDAQCDHIRIKYFPKEIQHLKPKCQWMLIECVQAGKRTNKCSFLPHRDTLRQSVLNIYFISNNEETRFYTNATQSYTLPDQSVNQDTLYLDLWVSEYASFVASRRDAYVLDVSQIHGLTELKPGTSRLILSLGFDETFQELVTLLSPLLKCPLQV